MDDNNKEVIDVLKNNVEIPEVVQRKKKEAYSIIMNSTKKKSMFNRKVIAAAITLCIIVVGTLNVDVLAKIRDILFPNIKGVQNAIDNNYTQKVSNVIMKDQGIEIAVENLVKDNSMFAMVLNIKFDDPAITKYVKYLRFENIQIFTEDGKLIPTCYHADNIKVDREKGQLYASIILSYDKVSFDFNISESEISNLDNVVIYISQINLMAGVDDEIGDDFKLPNISEKTESIYASLGLKELKFAIGQWKGKVKLDNKFKDSPVKEYYQEENNDYIKVISAMAYPTGTVIRYICLDREYLKVENDNIIIVDEEGNKYEPIGMSTEYPIGDKRAIERNLSMTSFNDVSNIRLIHTDSKGKEIEIKLKLKK